MNLDLLPPLRTRVGALLNQPTDALDAQALHTLVKTQISAEHEARRQAHGAGSTLTLNALLDIELQIRTKVFGLPRESIKSAF
jgi:hypothetical protein